MRIIHDVERPFQAGGGFTPYAAKKGCKSTGFRVELLLAPMGSIDRDDPYEEIFIEGDAHHVLEVLRETVSMIEQEASSLVEKGKLVRDWERR